MTVVFIALAILAGALLAAQQVVNSSFRQTIGSVWWAGLISYIGGTLFMIAALLLARDRAPSMAAFEKVPLAAWTGGVLGGLYIALSLIVLPRLGVAVLLSLIVVGQMLASISFDASGFLGVPQHQISVMRVFGAAMLVAGVVLIKVG